MKNPVIAPVLLAIFSLTAFAESGQTELTDESSDTTDISINITSGENGFILLTNLQPIDFGELGGANLPAPDDEGYITKGSKFCLYRTGISSGAVSYDLRVETLSLDNSFALRSGENSISYEVDHYSSGNYDGTSTPLTSGDQNSPMSQNANGTLGYDGTSYSCSSDNGSILVKLPFNDVISAAEGEYEDTLTLIVSAN